MSTQFTHRVVLVAPNGAAYDAARAATSQVTGEIADATANWRLATDGTLDDDDVPVATHRVADTLARASTVAALPTLQAQIGGSFYIIASGRGTPGLTTHMSVDDALIAAGVWLLTVDDEGAVVVQGRSDD